MEKHLAILHTTAATIGGMKALCAKLLPGTEVYHYLHDGLLPRINREGSISDAVRREFASLVALAAQSRPSAILSACSTVGELLEGLRGEYDIPLLRVDEPMARQAAACPGRVTVCATLPSTLGPTLRLIQRYRQGGSPVEALVLEEAGRLLNEGKRDEYLRSIAEALKKLAQSSDAVVLAQASMADALSLLPEQLFPRFLTSPFSGVSALKAYCEQEEKE